MATKAENLNVLLQQAAIPGRRASTVISVLEGEKELGAQLFARNYVEHKPWRKKGEELDLRELFPDLEVTVEDAIESGDRVIVRWRARGTHKGTFQDIKPTGNQIDVTGINIYRFAGKQIVESWGEVDSAQLQRQCSQVAPQISEFLARPAAAR